MIITPPTPLGNHYSNSIFLGGSIEMGQAEDWQTTFGNKCLKLGYTVLNPRRKEWDASWEQTLDNPMFVEQLEWEYKAQFISDTLLYYFHPNTKAPITLMELGHFVHYNKEIIVVCPKEYWRSGNVRFLCNKFGIDVHNSIDDVFTIYREG